MKLPGQAVSSGAGVAVGRGVGFGVGRGVGTAGFFLMTVTTLLHAYFLASVTLHTKRYLPAAPRRLLTVTFLTLRLVLAMTVYLRALP